MNTKLAQLIGELRRIYNQQEDLPDSELTQEHIDLLNAVSEVLLEVDKIEEGEKRKDLR